MIALYYAILVVILLLPVVQHFWNRRIVEREKQQKRERVQEQIASLARKYSQEIFKIGKDRMNDVISGKIKKQLITNDSPVYDSDAELQNFQKFMEDNSLHNRISQIKDTRYYG